jgi:outer membrane protease
VFCARRLIAFIASMKKYFIFLALISFVFRVFAQDSAAESGTEWDSASEEQVKAPVRSGILSAYTLELDLGMNYTYAQVLEKVFFSEDSKIESELCWTSNYILSAAFALEARQREPYTRIGFFAGAQLDAGIPMRSGYMVDRDWVKYEDLYSAFSQHDNYTTSYINFDAHIGVSIPFINRLLLRPSVGVKWINLVMTAADGYGEYRVTTEDFTGRVVKYTADWFLLYPSIAFRYKVVPSLEAEVSFNITPLVYYKGEDDHIVRKIIYYDKIDGGIYLQPSVRILYSPAKNFGAELSAGFFYSNAKGGSTEAKENGSTKQVSSVPGVSINCFDISLKFRLSL